jgi:hypothetical protein
VEVELETLVEQVAQGEVEHMTQVEVEVETPMGRWLRGSGGCRRHLRWRWIRRLK